MMKMMMTNTANTLYEVQPENQGDLYMGSAKYF